MRIVRIYLLLVFFVLCFASISAHALIINNLKVDYKKGQDVQVTWGKKWWNAKVQKIATNGRVVVYHIRYHGYGPEWDEWVKPRRVRKLFYY